MQFVGFEWLFYVFFLYLYPKNVMETIRHQIRYTRLRADELNEVVREQGYMALNWARKAYAPYSGFHVGALLELENGEFAGGNNQENAAYPSGLCAERVAIFAANARFPATAIRRIVVTAWHKGDITEQPVAPCGACRQVMFEKEAEQQSPIEIVLLGANDALIFNSVADLLPFAFGGETLKK